MAIAIITLVSNEQFGKEMSTREREVTVEKYSFGKILEQIAETCQSITKDRECA